MRVTVLNQSEPLRQVVEFITERGVDVEVVGETATLANLEALLKADQPDYLFLLQTEYDQLTEKVRRILEENPTLGVALVNERSQEVHLQVSDTPNTQGLTGQEQQGNSSTATRERPVIPHSPNEESREQTKAQAATTDVGSGTPAPASPTGWRTYTLSDFIYLMTADQPKTEPQGGITDVPHNP